MTYTVDTYEITNTRVPKSTYVLYLLEVTIPSGLIISSIRKQYYTIPDEQ